MMHGPQRYGHAVITARGARGLGDIRVRSEGIFPTLRRALDV